MLEMVFYEDKHGKQPVKEILIKLRDRAQASKDERIQYQKICNRLNNPILHFHLPVPYCLLFLWNR